MSVLDVSELVWARQRRQRPRGSPERSSWRRLVSGSTDVRLHDLAVTSVLHQTSFCPAFGLIFLSKKQQLKGKTVFT